MENDPDLRSRVLVTAQHRELLDQALAPFGIVPDVDLDLMRPGHTLVELTARVVESVDRVLVEEHPDLMLVQGDTTTVFASTLAAFYQGIWVGHVEAGLRSFDLANPFPEEANRRLTSQLARLHFAPTRRSVENLLGEGIPVESIFLTGNTVVDALLSIIERPDLPGPPRAWRSTSAAQDAGCRVLVTLHRRESWGEPFEGICRAIRRAAEALPELHFVYPVHPQPRVRDTAANLLGGHSRIDLVEPMDYLDLVAAQKASTFIVTDSGGIQEEAPILGKPVLVVRDVTERPEAIEAGTAWLVGTREEDVYEAIVTLATDVDRRQRMAHATSPFGDGRASERIVAAIRRFAGLPQLGDGPPALSTSG